MSDTKFTPGPWKKHFISRDVSFSDDDAYEIHGGGEENITEIVYEEADANLIAAAPDMYEALESIRKHCEEREQWNDDPVRFAAIANKALAKARGEL